ncbi:sporulation protein YpjB [Oceanobacillus damuensis]|uniref:sporulation protein YpjB n=1 Tax=Oceanobacillus damuensis TaxID=937928 RepID=UPI00082EDEDD|nr:sporulation protein YpjB [Oceanobacillus damuensis]
MVNRRRLLVQITTAALIGILIYIQFGSILAEASTINNTEVLEEKNNMDITMLIWTASIVGGSIICTLSYVSWKKYNAEVKSKEEAKKDKSVD